MFVICNFMSCCPIVVCLGDVYVLMYTSTHDTTVLNFEVPSLYHLRTSERFVAPICVIWLTW